MNDPPESIHLHRLVIRACEGAILCLFAAWALFTFVFYPVHGLTGLGRRQHEAAIMRAAKEFASSESMVATSLERSRFEAVGENSNAYAWGTVTLLTPGGDHVHLWVSLRWSAFWQRWHRNEILILADPRDRLFFAQSLLSLGSIKKTLYIIQNVRRETLRQIREVSYDLIPG